MNSENIRENQRSQFWLVFIVLMVVAFALFANTFGAQWTYDDYPVIVDNPDILSIANFLKDQFPGRPLREFTYLLDHALFGMQPAGWHVQQIFWHGLCAWLVWLLVLRLDFGRVVAWLSALMFLVHPVQVEAVANLSHRKESLALAFCLLALLAFIRGCGEAGRSRIPWLLGALVLAWVAYLGKQTAVAVFPLFLVYEWIYLPRERWCLLHYWRGMVVIGGIAVIGFAAWLVVGGGAERYLIGIKEVLPFKANYFGEMTWSAMFRTAVKSWLFMAAKWLLPVGLAAEYVIDVPGGWFDPWVLCGLLLVAGYLAGLVMLGRRRSPLLLPAIWVGLFYLPVANLWPLAYLAADRYLYAPTVGVAVLFAVLLQRLLSSRPALLWAVSCALLLILSTLTWWQNRVWLSEETLWMHAVKVNPTSSFALNNVGNLYAIKQDYETAYQYYSRAIEANQLNGSAHYNIGMIFERHGDLPRALQFYRNFLILRHPEWAKAQANLEKYLRDKYGFAFVNEEFVKISR